MSEKIAGREDGRLRAIIRGEAEKVVHGGRRWFVSMNTFPVKTGFITVNDGVVGNDETPQDGFGVGVLKLTSHTRGGEVRGWAQVRRRGTSWDQ